MRSLWLKMKEIWWDFWEVDNNDNGKKHLSSSDKRWLLYWNFLSGVGVLAIVVLVMGINTLWVQHQNNMDVEKTLNTIATYMASATKDEYEDIAQSIRHDLVFSEYGKDIENFIQYIPNTTETCYTYMDNYQAQALLVCANAE